MPYFVYILTNRSGTLYTGCTKDLVRRLNEHRQGDIPGFTRRYRITRLVYFEETGSSLAMLQRERQIKGWSRAKKIALIESMNPTWKDLAEDWA